MSDVQGVLGKDWHQDIRYPLVFPVTTGQKVACWIGGLFLGGFGGFLVILAQQDHSNAVLSFFLGAAGMGCLFGLIACFTYASRAKVVVEARAIEVQGAFSSRRLDLKDIKGRRTVQTKAGRYPVLIPRAGANLRITASTFGLDDRFNAWLRAVPDLDAEDREASLKEVSQDASLGANPAERLAALEKAKKLAKLLGFLGIGLMVWGYLYPHPYGWFVAVAAAVPWVAVVLLWARPGLFQLEGKTTDVKPNIVALTLFPMMVIGVRALMDLTVIDLQPLFLWGAICGVPLFIALALRPKGATAPQGRVAMTVLMLPLSIAYGMGLLALTDALWDHANAAMYQTAIVGKNVSRGKTTTYYLDLAPWSADITKDHVSVPRSFYEAVQRGDTVCVRVHPGKFGLRWMQVSGCG